MATTPKEEIQSLADLLYKSPSWGVDLMSTYYRTQLNRALSCIAFYENSGQPIPQDLLSLARGFEQQLVDFESNVPFGAPEAFCK